MVANREEPKTTSWFIRLSKVMLFLCEVANLKKTYDKKLRIVLCTLMTSNVFIFFLNINLSL